MEKLILITNDDGIEARGLQVLEYIAAQFGEVFTVAPANQKSGVSHSITLYDPLRVLGGRPNRYALDDGTPADCVFVGVGHLCPRRPDLVLSGINFGLNVASDVVYSGTVGGAREGTLQGIPSIAISMDSGPKWDPTPAAPFLSTIIERMLSDTNLHKATLNVNIPGPNIPIQGIRTSTFGTRRFRNEVDARKDPRGGDYLWLGGDTADVEAPPGSDCEALEKGFISVTAVQPYSHATREQARLPSGDW